MRLYTNESSPWIMTQQNNMAWMRLFCFPYAGGGALAFRQWSDNLSDRVEVCAVQPPGRENRISEPPIADVHELVSRLLPEMLPLLGKPFVFLGYSTGALVAFELIRALIRQKMPFPKHLIVSAARAPHIPEPSPLHDLPEDEFISELKRFSGTPDAVLENKELMSIYSPLLRADLAIEETYTFKKDSPFNIPITAFYGAEDEEASRKVMEPWKEHTSSAFTLIQMEGGHFFIRTAMDAFLSSVSNILNEL